MSADNKPAEPARAERARDEHTGDVRTGAERATADDERRVNPVLRSQVEDMLASIRAAASRESWTDEERAQHEAGMARIMELVREHALSRGRHR